MHLRIELMKKINMLSPRNVDKRRVIGTIVNTGLCVDRELPQ
jgi:hypothetical protein